MHKPRVVDVARSGFAGAPLNGPGDLSPAQLKSLRELIHLWSRPSAKAVRKIGISDAEDVAVEFRRISLQLEPHATPCGSSS